MKQFSRILAFAVLLPVSLLACDDEDEPDPGAEVASVRITSGTQTVTINEGGTATGSLTIPRNTATAITVTALRANGSTVALPSDFRFDVFPPASITFGRTGNFAGTLTGTTAGTFSVPSCIFHVGEGHCDFGSQTTHAFSVTVQ
jgi:hypothetical protein